MMRFTGDNLRISAIVFMIAYSIMPFVAIAVSTYLTTYLYMAVSLLIFILIVMERKQESFNEVLATTGPFLVYGILTYFTNTDSIALWGYQLLLFIMPIIVSVYVLRYHECECSHYAKVIIISIVITIITTAIGLENNPGASRWLATVQTSDDPRLIMYSWKNIGGYGFVYTLVLMYPLLVLAFKKRKITFFKTALIVLLMLSCLMLAEYTIAIVLFVATTTLFFMKKDLQLKDITVFIAITILFMFIFSKAMSNIVKSIANNIDSNIISSRLNDLSDGAEGLQKSNDKRFSIYMMSLNTFFRHPFGTFISTGRSAFGGHSFILDFLAQYGIFGLLTLIYMYRKIYYLFYYKYRNKEDYGYIVWIFSQAVLLSILNTGMWVNILALYIPVILCILYGGSEDEENSLGGECAT
jgi:hypothetical protein